MMMMMIPFSSHRRPWRSSGRFGLSTTTQMVMVLMIWMSCCCRHVVVVQADDLPPNMTLARKSNFEIPADVVSANITCRDAGTRCTYQSADYKDVKYSGQPTATTDGLVWAATTPATDYLAPGPCVSAAGVCYIRCNAGCVCNTTSADGSTEECPQVASVPPKTAAPTPVPPPQVCPKQKNTDLCKQMMPRVPPNNFFNCYNFCGGIFTTSCKFSDDSCTPRECTNATASGTDSIIQGCTDADRTSDPNNGGGGGAGKNGTQSSGGSGGGGGGGKSSSSHRRPPFMLVLLALLPMMNNIIAMVAVTFGW